MSLIRRITPHWQRWKLKSSQVYNQLKDHLAKIDLGRLHDLEQKLPAPLKAFASKVFHHPLIAPIIGYRKVWLFWACLVPVLLLTCIQILRSPRLYQSSAVVQVDQWQEPAVKPMTGQFDIADLRDEDSLKTIEQNLQNSGIFVNLAGDPKIAGDRDFLVGYSGSRKPVSTLDVAGWLQSNTQVGLRRGTRLIDITVLHRIPSMAQKLAQAVVDHFVLLDAQTHDSQRQFSHQLLGTQSERIRKNLQESEDTLQMYKEALLLRDRIDDQQPVVDMMEERYGGKNPQLVQAQELLAHLKQTFNAEFARVIANSETEATLWSANRSDLGSAPADGDITSELKFVAARGAVLQKEVDAESALFDSLLKQMRESDINEDSSQSAIHVVQRPILPQRPALPRKMSMLMVGLLGGTVLGIVTVALSRALDSSIQNPAEAEALLGIPVVGTIAELPARKDPPPPENTLDVSEPRPVILDEDIVTATDPGGLAAEEFRSLRTSVRMLRDSPRQRSVLFVSPFPGEGKTFISCNYAMTVAQSRQKTLLVDADLRRPSIHWRLNLQNKSGLFDVMANGADLRSVVHKRFTPYLDVLTAGSTCSLPAEVLGGPGFARFLEKALPRYDRIIIDSSPVNLVSDALLIAGLVDSIFLVIRASSTTRQAALQAVALLRRARKEPSGVVLNALEPISAAFRPRYFADAPDNGRNYEKEKAYS